MKYHIWPLEIQAGLDDSRAFYPRPKYTDILSDPASLDAESLGLK